MLCKLSYHWAIPLAPKVKSLKKLYFASFLLFIFIYNCDVEGSGTHRTFSDEISAHINKCDLQTSSAHSRSPFCCPSEGAGRTFPASSSLFSLSVSIFLLLPLSLPFPHSLPFHQKILLHLSSACMTCLSLTQHRLSPARQSSPVKVPTCVVS